MNLIGILLIIITLPIILNSITYLQISTLQIIKSGIDKYQNNITKKHLLPDKCSLNKNIIICKNKDAEKFYIKQ
jgi:hypothetical protein